MEFEDLSPHIINLIIKHLVIEDVKELSSLNPELESIISYIFRSLPFQINNLVIRIGYELDSFEYLINGEYYAYDLSWEEEPGNEYVKVDPFMIDPRASKIIGIFFYLGDTDPMFYQEKDGRLIELTPRDRFIEEIALIYVLEFPDPVARIIPEEPLEILPLKEPDPSILKQIHEIKYGELEGDLDKILNIRPIPGYKELKETIPFDVPVIVPKIFPSQGLPSLPSPPLSPQPSPPLSPQPSPPLSPQPSPPLSPQRFPSPPLIPMISFTELEQLINSNEITEIKFESSNLLVVTTKSGQTYMAKVFYDPETNKIFPST